MNKVTLMGRITKELEIKYSASNMALLSFTVAVNRRKKDETDFISCKAFDKTAENIAKYFKKGAMIAVCGRIQTGNYEKDGKKVYTTDVMVDEFHFTGEKKDEQEQQINHNPGFFPVDNEGDELPF
jgi:single-strand DNA-binding protein